MKSAAATIEYFIFADLVGFEKGSRKIKIQVCYENERLWYQVL